MAEEFAVCLGVDANAGAITRTALDGDGVKDLDFAVKRLAAEEDREEKAEVVEAAAGLEGDEAKAVCMEAGPGGQVAQDAAEVADADGKQFGDLFDAGPAG